MQCFSVFYFMPLWVNKKTSSPRPWGNDTSWRTSTQPSPWTSRIARAELPSAVQVLPKVLIRGLCSLHRKQFSTVFFCLKKQNRWYSQCKTSTGLPRVRRNSLLANYHSIIAVSLKNACRNWDENDIIETLSWCDKFEFAFISKDIKLDQIFMNN